jgi:hypothetical protein
MNILSSMLNYLLTKAQSAANTIGTGTIATTANTLIGAVNELNAKRHNDTAAGYTSESKALTTSYGIVPMSGDYILGSSFQTVSDGGYRALRNGTLLVSAYAYVSGVNAGDVVAVNIGRYNGGWVWESVTTLVAGTTERSCVIANLPVGVNANDIVYLRARNITSARGNVTSARMVAEYV